MTKKYHRIIAYILVVSLILFGTQFPSFTHDYDQVSYAHGPANLQEARLGAANANMAATQLQMKLMALQACISIMYFTLYIIQMFGKDIFPYLRNWVRNLSTKKATQVDYSDTNNILCTLRKELDKNIVGQKKAKEKIIRLIAGYFESIKEAQLYNVQYQKGLAIYVIGRGKGIGKTTAIKCIAKVLGKSCFFVRRSDIRTDKSANALNVSQQLMDNKIKDSGSTKIEEKTDFRLRVENGSNTMFVFDEYKRMLECDPERSLDELLIRDFIDTAHIGRYECLNSIVAFSTNETLEEVKASHDEAIFNRIQDCIVEFDDLSHSDYCNIIRRSFDSLRYFYKNEYGIDIILPEKTINLLSDIMIEKNSGARSIEVIMRNLKSDLLDYRNGNNNTINMKTKKIPKWIIKYNILTSRFEFSTPRVC